MCRSDVAAVGIEDIESVGPISSPFGIAASGVEVFDPVSSRLWIAEVKMQVCVTLRGIIVFLIGAFRTICAASAKLM